MTPYAAFDYFILIALVAIPLVVLGAMGRAGRGWIIGATVIVLIAQAGLMPLKVTPSWVTTELTALVVFGLYQWVLVMLIARKVLPKRPLLVVPLSLVPLIVAKYVPLWLPDFHFGFGGVSYATFRGLDVIFSMTDGALAEVAATDFFAFIFFFPTLSSGPIDRFRRFKPELHQVRSAAQFWQDVDAGVALIFRGLLYKFVIATILDRQLVDHVKKIPGLLGAVEYAYAYSAYLFFDFAGYSAFAIGVSRWFGIRTPDNFNLPWAARNIRDFWNRWHMSLSFWFRDHVYMRFLLKARKGKWFRKPETASNVAYFVSFGLMGVWHGLTWFYILYGLYHAVLFNIFDLFGRWKKSHPGRCEGRAWKWFAHFLTVHAVIAGFWLFSGHGWITPEMSLKMRHDATAAAAREQADGK